MLHWFRTQALQLTVATAIGAVTFLSVFFLRDAGYLEYIELSTYDLLIQNKHVEPIDDRIVVIGETEKDIHRFGHPLSDGILAQLIEKLTAAGAWSIGIDKYRDIPVPPGIERLKKVINETPNVIWVYNKDILPPSSLIGTNQIGINDIPLDNDGIVRRGLLFTEYKGNDVYSFALLLALYYLNNIDVYPTQDGQYMRLGNTTLIPLTTTTGSYINADKGGYQFLIDYSGMPNQFTPDYTLSDLLDDKIPTSALANKVVLFGAKAESLNDYFFSPFNKTRANRVLYGVELHAYIVSQLLRMATDNKPAITTLTDNEETFLLAVWIFIGISIGLWLHSLVRFILITLVGGSILIGSYYLAFNYYIWIPLVPPLLAFVLSITLVTSFMRSQQKKERKMVMQLFEQHVSSAVAETVWEQRDTFLEEGRLTPKRVVATVLFTDIKGFTTVSESMDPKELMDWLNTYMTEMANVVIKHNGTINKYIGDAVMALFGAPLHASTEEGYAENAIAAVNCGLEMSTTLEEMNKKWRAENLPEIGMRVGIYTGPLVAGSLGSSQRLEYTVIGDTVNTASRLESYKRPDDPEHPAETSNCRILVGERTRQYLSDEMYTISHYGSVKLKGKTDEVDIYWVQAKQTNAPDSEVES